MQYGDEIALLRDGLSLRRVRSRTGRAINTLRKLRTLFVIWIIDRASPHPQQPPSATPIPIYPSHRWPLSPSMHTDATCRTTSTLGNLSKFFEMMQPDNLMARHHIQKSVRLFEALTLGNQSGCISVKGCDELGMDGIRGTTGEPTIYSWKLKHHNCIGCRIFSYLCREFFEGIAG